MSPNSTSATAHSSVPVEPTEPPAWKAVGSGEAPAAATTARATDAGYPPTSRMPPPASRGSRRRWSSGSSAPKENVDATCRTSPIAPAETSSSTRRKRGWCRYMKASASSTPARLASSTTTIACAWFTASGFSTSTCLPARTAAIAQRACSVCTVAR